MQGEKPAPKVFISYAWTSVANKEEVMQFANSLVSDGIDVKIDQWDLKEGQDVHKYMEGMVTDNTITKVLILCNKKYMHKGDNREGGVGVESTIISGEIYNKAENTKFIPIIWEKDENGETYIPTFLKSRFYIDLSDAEIRYSENYSQLLRAILDKPVYQKPKLGKIPSHILEDNISTNLTATKHRSLLKAIREGKNIDLFLKDYLEAYFENLENFRIEFENEEQKEQVEKFLKNLDSFKYYRDEFLEVVDLISKAKIMDRGEYLIEFFTRITKFQNPKEEVMVWKEVDLENFKFIIYELFTTTLATLIHNKDFETIATMCKKIYMVKDKSGNPQRDSYDVFYYQGNFFNLIQKVRKTNFIFPMMNYIHEDRLSKYFSFDDIKDIDIILYLYSKISNIRSKINVWWYPRSACYTQYRKSLLFMEFISKTEAKKMEAIFGLDWTEKLRKMPYDNWIIQTSGGRSPNIGEYIGISELGTED